MKEHKWVSAMLLYKKLDHAATPHMAEYWGCISEAAAHYLGGVEGDEWHTIKQAAFDKERVDHPSVIKAAHSLVKYEKTMNLAHLGDVRKHLGSYWRDVGKRYESKAKRVECKECHEELV